MGFLSSILGGSKSSSQQRQESSSSGLSLNRGTSSSTSGGRSSGYSRGVSGSSSSVFGADIFRQLYGGAADAAGAIDPGLAAERNAQLFTGGSSIIERLAGGGAGTDYLERRLSGDGGEVLNAQIDAIGSDLGRFLSEDLNPVITGSSVAGGALGGGRQGVAQGKAVDSVLREFATQAGNLRAADIAQRDSAALGLMGAQNASAQTALGSLAGLSELGSGLESLSPYAALSSILGGPTVLTESFGQEESSQQSEEFAQSLAEEFGISYDQAKSLLTASSKGKSSGGLLPAIGSIVGGGG